ncbi:uncharacterized HTH-type transcriptional regulator PH1916 [Arthrobacter sp. Hiyo6]|nr:uncharacterized HTH-type transcriptional regulator PH1916 [Arthrobacter sp. Hiyo6]
MITAFVLIKTDASRIPETAEEISAIPGISEVYSVTGEWDLIAVARVAKHEDLADVIADKLSKCPRWFTPPPTSLSARIPSTTWTPLSRWASKNSLALAEVD